MSKRIEVKLSCSYAKKKNVGPNIHLLSKYVTETGGLFVTPNPLNSDDKETGGMILQKGRIKSN